MTCFSIKSFVSASGITTVEVTVSKVIFLRS